MSTKGPKPKAPKAPKASKAAKTLTKAQMVADLADRAGLTKAQVQDVFAALADVVAAELKAGRPATIPAPAWSRAVPPETDMVRMAIQESRLPMKSCWTSAPA